MAATATAVAPATAIMGPKTGEASPASIGKAETVGKQMKRISAIVAIGIEIATVAAAFNVDVAAESMRRGDNATSG